MTYSEYALLYELELEACQPSPYFKSKREENSQQSEKEVVKNAGLNRTTSPNGPIRGDRAAEKPSSRQWGQ